MVIGGGTGTTPVLSGLKQFDQLDISVIVSMTDDGGSNAVVRDEFGLLPLSDLRKSIVALSEDHSELLRDIFTYRFSKGNGLSGHTLGNLILMGLSEIKGSEIGAVEALSDLFHVKGKVIPVTLEQTHLVAEYEDGSIVKSEHLIDEPPFEKPKRIKNLSLEPTVPGFEDAIEALVSADYIIVGPGDLYTTTLANIIVDGIAQAIRDSRAEFIFISNLMTKRGQTDTMKASDIAQEITRYTGRKPDILLLHNGVFSPEALEMYAEDGSHPIEDDLPDGEHIIRIDLLYDEIIQKQAGDTLTRSLLRHDADKLAQILSKIMKIKN